jgi:hypothetical protein
MGVVIGKFIKIAGGSKSVLGHWLLLTTKGHGR